MSGLVRHGGRGPEASGQGAETCGSGHTGCGVPCLDSHTKLRSRGETNQDTCCCFLYQMQAFG